MSALNFVNVHGDPVSIAGASKKLKRPAKDPVSFHNGWRVIGIPPGAEEEARRAREAAARTARSEGLAKLPPEFDLEHWRMTFKKKPVRSKPYELESAARECKSLAEKAGWTFVEIEEKKLEIRPQ
ncbi:MAG: hypothetical protein J0H69_17050 [Burkholderiales bacterium]|nr:hypothetical protein [Burkholderiales bacterium]